MQKKFIIGAIIFPVGLLLIVFIASNYNINVVIRTAIILAASAVLVFISTTFMNRTFRTWKLKIDDEKITLLKGNNETSVLWNDIKKVKHTNLHNDMRGINIILKSGSPLWLGGFEDMEQAIEIIKARLHDGVEQTTERRPYHALRSIICFVVFAAIFTLSVVYAGKFGANLCMAAVMFFAAGFLLFWRSFSKSDPRLKWLEIIYVVFALLAVFLAVLSMVNHYDFSLI